MVQFIKMLLLGYVFNLNKKLLYGNFQNLACGRSIFSITSKKWRANDFACKTLVRNYRDCPTPRKYSTKSFPNILDFTSCRDYLRAILSNNDLNIVSKDWPHLLDQIVDTLPAGSILDKGDKEQDPIVLDSKITHKKEFITQRRYVTGVVKQYFCHTFALGVCAELQNTAAALSLLEHMVTSNEEVSNNHRKMVLKSFCNDAKQKYASEDERQNVLASKNLLDQILGLCDACLEAEKTNKSGYSDVLVNIAATYAYTEKWLKGYELWENMRSNAEIDLHKCAVPLAFAALENGREDIFWKVVNDHSFHLNHIHLRFGAKDNRLVENMLVYIQYVRYCANNYARSPELFDKISQLFEYFNKHFMMVSPEFSIQLENIANHNKTYKDTTRLNVRRLTYYIGPSGGPSTCKNCLQPIESQKLDEKDAHFLKNSIIDRLIIRDDVFKSTDPKELKKFQVLLSKNTDYDIVIDGLNLCGIVSKWDKRPDKKGIAKLSNSRDYKVRANRHLPAQSFVLFSVVKGLHDKGLKILLIHRQWLKRMPCFKEIRELCQYVILEDESDDDLFFIASALNSGPGTYILTNDLLMQHSYALKDGYLQQLFSYWQMQAQVKCKWLTLKGFRESKNEKFHFETFKESDGTIRKPHLMFPDNRVLRATKTSGGWHIPIVAREPKDLQPTYMVNPSDWVCVC